MLKGSDCWQELLTAFRVSRDKSSSHLWHLAKFYHTSKADAREVCCVMNIVAFWKVFTSLDKVWPHMFAQTACNSFALWHSEVWVSLCHVAFCSPFLEHLRCGALVVCCEVVWNPEHTNSSFPACLPTLKWANIVFWSSSMVTSLLGLVAGVLDQPECSNKHRLCPVLTPEIKLIFHWNLHPCGPSACHLYWECNPKLCCNN